MLRINSRGSVDGKFVDKDLIEGIEGTTFDHGWLKSIQEEIANVSDSRGIVREENIRLRDAIQDMGSLKDATLPIQNGVTNKDLGFNFNKDKVKAAVFLAIFDRKTSKIEQCFLERYLCGYNSVEQKWSLYSSGLALPDPSVILSVTPDGVLQYQSTLFPNDNYEGQVLLCEFETLKEIS